MTNKTFRLIVAGTRTFCDYSLLSRKVSESLRNKKAQGYDVIIVSGCANGADKLGERFAMDNGYEIEKFPANWKEHGKAAGPIRNAEMARHADGLISFWDGKSRGTRSMIDLAKKHGLKTVVIRVD